MSQIQSISYDQDYIIKSIMELCGIERFDADLTYGNGGFWKNLPQPIFRFDIDPQDFRTHLATSTDVPLDDEAVESIMFDPPFLTYIKAGREHNSVMGKRFSGYWRYDELEEHYRGTIKEAHRLLSNKGVFVVKCQDIIHNHKMHATHINVVNWAAGMFRLKDLFVLAAKHRMPMPESTTENKRKQKHARVHHSYFLVLEKL
jgi:tRNA G10  N-methylase Trm11